MGQDRVIPHTERVIPHTHIHTHSVLSAVFHLITNCISHKPFYITTCFSQPSLCHMSIVYTFSGAWCPPSPLEVCSSCQSVFVLVYCCCKMLRIAFETHLGVLSLTSMHGSALHVSQSHSPLSKGSNCYMRPALNLPQLLDCFQASSRLPLPHLFPVLSTTI